MRWNKYWGNGVRECTGSRHIPSADEATTSPAGTVWVSGWSPFIAFDAKKFKADWEAACEKVVYSTPGGGTYHKVGDQSICTACKRPIVGREVHQIKSASAGWQYCEVERVTREPLYTRLPTLGAVTAIS